MDHDPRGPTTVREWNASDVSCRSKPRTRVSRSDTGVGTRGRGHDQAPTTGPKEVVVTGNIRIRWTTLGRSRTQGLRPWGVVDKISKYGGFHGTRFVGDPDGRACL